MQDALVVKICRYLRAAAIRHTAVVKAFRAHSANKTFCRRRKKRRTAAEDRALPSTPLEQETPHGDVKFTIPGAPEELR